MPVISIANPKGGTGKTTTALLLGLELAKSAAVAIIDADPNRIVYNWGRQREEANKPVPLSIAPAPEESELIRTISTLAVEKQFVLIDLEGTASRTVSRAFARSDLVLIPLNPSPIDARQAAAAVRLVHEESEVLQRRIPYCLAFVRTNAAIVTRDQAAIAADLEHAHIPILSSTLIERAAYRAVFRDSALLEDLDPKTVSGLENAAKNVRTFTADIVTFLRTLQPPKATS